MPQLFSRLIVSLTILIPLQKSLATHPPDQPNQASNSTLLGFDLLEEQSSLLLAMSPTANPADVQVGKPRNIPPPHGSPRSLSDYLPERVPSYQLPAVEIVGQKTSDLRSEDRVGTYKQPRWTATRRFPTTRVYVVPEGKVEVEYWLRTTFEDKKTKYRNLYEIEFGLPHRFQLDLYLRTEQEDEGPVHTGQSIELRYALADWGQIPGNPTLYLEWVKLDDEPDVIEAKLLLGDELAPRWHWGINLVTEMQTSGNREHEYQLTGGLSYTVLDMGLSIGAEGVIKLTDDETDRGDMRQSYLIGPSLQIKPLPPLTFNVVALAGIGPDAPRAQLLFNLGWEF